MNIHIPSAASSSQNIDNNITFQIWQSQLNNQQKYQWIAVYIDDKFYLTTISAYQKLQDLENQIQMEKKRLNGINNQFKEGQKGQYMDIAREKQKNKGRENEERKKKDRKNSMESSFSRECHTEINEIKMLKAKFEAEKALVQQQMRYENKTMEVRKRRQLKQTTYIIKQHKNGERYRDGDRSVEDREVSQKKSVKSKRSYMIAPHQLSGKRSIEKEQQKQRKSSAKQSSSNANLLEQGKSTKFKEMHRYYQTIQPRRLHQNQNKEQQSILQCSNTVKKSQKSNEKKQQNYFTSSKSKQKSFVITSKRPPTSNSYSKSQRNQIFSKSDSVRQKASDKNSQVTYSKDEIEKLTQKLKQMQYKLMKVEKRQRQLELLEKQREKEIQLKRNEQELVQKVQRSSNNSSKMSQPTSNKFMKSIHFKSDSEHKSKKIHNQQNSNIQIQLQPTFIIQPDKQMPQQNLFPSGIEPDTKKLDEIIQMSAIPPKQKNLQISNTIFEYNYNEELERERKEYEEAHQKQKMAEQIEELKRVIRQLQIEKIKQQALVRDIYEQEKSDTIKVNDFLQTRNDINEIYYRSQNKNNRKVNNKYYGSLGQISQNETDNYSTKQKFFSIKQIPEVETCQQISSYIIPPVLNENENSDKPLIKKQVRRYLKVESQRSSDFSQITNPSEMKKKVSIQQQNFIIPTAKNNNNFVVGSQEIRNRVTIRNSGRETNNSSCKKIYSQSEYPRGIEYRSNQKDQEQSIDSTSKRKGSIVKQIINREKFNSIQIKRQSPKKNFERDEGILKIQSKTLEKEKSQPKQYKQRKKQMPFQAQSKRIKSQQLEKQFEKPTITLPIIKEIQALPIPQLPQPPTIEATQGEILARAKKLCNIFDIKIQEKDQLQFKKYKNCIILKSQSKNMAIVWHYSGKFYVGGWNQKSNGSDDKNGEGFELIPEKHYYKGEFLEGKRHGFGTMVMPNGNIYQGDWLNGQRNGKGIFHDKKLNISYEGEWKEGKRHGKGILKAGQKQFYTGEFDKNIKSGFGTQLFSNGDLYQGEYKNGNFDGKGKYFWANGSIYVGNFVDGFRQGFGKWKSDVKAGDIYEGYYKKDKKSGKGKYTWFKGCCFEGEFLNDLKHGSGKVQYPDGRQIVGIWEFGKLKEVQKSNKSNIVEWNEEYEQISPRIRHNIPRTKEVSPQQMEKSKIFQRS